MVRIGLVVVFIHVLGWLLMYVVLSVSINSVFFLRIKQICFELREGTRMWE